MVATKERIEALHQLGEWLRDVSQSKTHPDREEFDNQIISAFHQNGWFTKPEVERALHYWANHLKREILEAWLTPLTEAPTEPKRVLLILAGNIPLVGMHDWVSTILSGNTALVKCASNDSVLLPMLIRQLGKLSPGLQPHSILVNGLQKEFDAVLATGSNNAARHFEAYFSHVPLVVRKNRTGIAVLNGAESDQELEALMEDAFAYFGLGCRNITKLFLPQGYDLNRIFKASMPFKHLMENKKYANNYTYHKAVMMMERQNFLENDLIILRESPSLFSPVSILHYEFYNDVNELNQMIESNLDNIQCVVGKEHIPFGDAQKPRLTDYADGINTLEFLLNLEPLEAAK
jgi:hypothetical protein